MQEAFALPRLLRGCWGKFTADAYALACDAFIPAASGASHFLEANHRNSTDRSLVKWTRRRPSASGQAC